MKQTHGEPWRVIGDAENPEDCDMVDLQDCNDCPLITYRRSQTDDIAEDVLFLKHIAACVNACASLNVANGELDEFLRLFKLYYIDFKSSGDEAGPIITALIKAYEAIGHSEVILNDAEEDALRAAPPVEVPK
jgi:hypothetical protein